MTMTNFKTLALAAVTVLSLGGVAMAQEGAPSMPTVDYWAAKTIATQQAQRADGNQIQSGSADANTLNSGVAHLDYSDLANPG
jgi:hypothetical protein